MAVTHEDSKATGRPRFCQDCGHPLGGANFCPDCGRPVDTESAVTDATTEMPAAAATPTAEMPAAAELSAVNLPPSGGATPPAAAGGSGRPRSRVILIAAAGALVLALGAVLAIILINNSSGGTSSSGQPSAYRAKLGSALAPVISANQSLSKSLQALDGSKKTLAAASDATSQAQSAIQSARGAISVLTPGSSDSTLSQQAQQALTEENGYLQALSSTLANPAGQSSSQLRPLITSTQSAMVPLGTVAPGATSSLSGVDNVINWVAGATAVNHAAKQSSQQPQQQSSSPPAQAAPPSSSPTGLTACDQNISVNSSTSCQFADNVFALYSQDVQGAGGPGSYYVYAFSPANGQSYNDACNYNSANQIVLCSHGTDLVQFPYWAAEVYQPQ